MRFTTEKSLIKQGFKTICGIDEVGRGALAGPAAVAGVVFSRKLFLSREKAKFFREIKDSKKLNAKNREKWLKEIKKHAKEIKIAVISHRIIDEINVQNAILGGVNRVVLKFKTKPDYFLLDGGLHINSKFKNQKSKIKIKTQNFGQKTIIRGDEGVFSIACASIIAKVYRDNLMKRYAKKYPKYKFEIHKGYGTKMHFKRIKKYKPCSIHRKSFL